MSVSRAGSDRWIGFAGSPRGERPKISEQGADNQDGVGEELLQPGSGSGWRGSSRLGNGYNNHGEDTGENLGAVPHDGGGAGSEEGVEEELEEILSGISP